MFVVELVRDLWRKTAFLSLETKRQRIKNDRVPFDLLDHSEKALQFAPPTCSTELVFFSLVNNRFKKLF